MAHNDWTDMGGTAEVFLTTHWSLVDAARKKGDRNSVLIGLLMERYWKPVYCYLRRKGHGNEQAKDLTQGFFHEIVLNRQLIARADPQKGSFRSLLLHALRHYVIDEKRRDAAASQIPREKLVPLDMENPPEVPDESEGVNPESSFNYAWKADLLERALSQVQDSYVKRKLESHWAVFYDRILKPVLEDEPQPSLKELCERYGIENERRASNMLGTVRRRFHTTLTGLVRQTVSTADDVEDEFGEIARFLRK